MGKPEIIGYETDHSRAWDCPETPEITFDAEGISIPWTALDAHGNFFTYQRYLKEYEIDPFMRKHGMKRVYKERPFRAWPAFGGYRVLCKRCDTITLTGNVFPHDTASRHQCLYTPETNDKE